MNSNPSLRIAAAVVLAALLATTGCATAKKLAAPKHSLAEDLADLETDLEALPAFPPPESSRGSLWTDGGPGAALVRDTRAFRPGDLVTIRVSESTSGESASTTELDRSSEADFGVTTLFGREDPSRASPQFNLAEVFNASSETSFSGDGTTGRSSTLSAFITTRVMRVLPNGDLIVAGQKSVTVNRERQILTLVGSVRPVDIDAANRVGSAAVGDLTVRLWGRGEVDATTKQGWFVRVMNRLWPF